MKEAVHLQGPQVKEKSILSAQFCWEPKTALSHSLLGKIKKQSKTMPIAERAGEHSLLVC